jgi:transposase
MPSQNDKLRVLLTAKVRWELERLCRQGCAPAAKVRKARILLLADENRAEGSLPDHEIAKRVGLCERQVVRIRQKFVREGGTPALERKRRSRPGTTPKFDGRAEARLVALCCSKPPEGRTRWTMRLLADELGRLQIVTSVCPETVRKCLKKTGLSLGSRSDFASPRRIARGS